jgi:hypothetical protein
MLPTKRNHAYAETIQAMVGDLYRTCSSETHRDAQLADPRAMRAVGVRARPIRMLNVFAE